MTTHGPLTFLVALLLGAWAHAEGWPDLSRPPPARGGGEKDAALIIGIEGYLVAPPVPGAADNARAWYAYFTKTRGVPVRSVRLLLDRDAALEEMRAEAARVAAEVKPGGTLWVIFIGHGAPAEDGKDGVLVGVDAQQSVTSLYARSLRQQELLSLVGKGKQGLSVVLIDACFSGRSPAGNAIVEGLQPLIALNAASTVRTPRAVVLSAGTSRQFAGPLPGGSVPAFSYLALGALRGWGDSNSDGVVTAGEVDEYANQALGSLLRGRAQTPELAPVDKREVQLASVGPSAEQGPDLADLVLLLNRGSRSAGAASGSRAPEPAVVPRSEEPVTVVPPAQAPRPSAIALEAPLSSAKSAEAVAQGDGLMKAKRYREAMNAYQAAVDADPSNSEAHFKHGTASAVLGFYSQAIASWTRVTELTNDPAVRESARGNIEKARGKLAAAPSAPSMTAPEWYEQGVRQITSRDYANALASLNEALKRDPTLTVAYVARGSSLLGLRRNAEALEDYRYALRRDPSSASPLYGMAECLRALGELAAAKEYYLKYLASSAPDVRGDLKDDARVKAAGLGR